MTSSGQQSTPVPEKARIWQFSYLRLTVFFVLILGYVFVVRPGRALITQQVVYPVTAQLTASEPDRFHLPESQKSVTFTLYEQTETGWTEMIYSTPWGFYLILPLLFFCFVAHYKPYLYVHAALQMLFGIVAILSYLGGVGLAEGLMHVYRMLTYYLTPGASFIIIFAAIFRQSFIQSRLFLNG